jgi:hypothetical protein
MFLLDLLSGATGVALLDLTAATRRFAAVWWDSALK